MLFYPAIKQLTLDLAATAFFGRDLGADREPLKRAFIDMVAAAVAVVRAPLPGTLMGRGVAGRRFMVDRSSAARSRRGAPAMGATCSPSFARRPPTTADC